MQAFYCISAIRTPLQHITKATLVLAEQAPMQRKKKVSLQFSLQVVLAFLKYIFKVLTLSPFSGLTIKGKGTNYLSHTFCLTQSHRNLLFNMCARWSFPLEIKQIVALIYQKTTAFRQTEVSLLLCPQDILIISHLHSRSSLLLITNQNCYQRRITIISN